MLERKCSGQTLPFYEDISKRFHECRLLKIAQCGEERSPTPFGKSSTLLLFTYWLTRHRSKKMSTAGMDVVSSLFQHIHRTHIRLENGVVWTKHQMKNNIRYPDDTELVARVGTFYFLKKKKKEKSRSPGIFFSRLPPPFFLTLFFLSLSSFRLFYNDAFLRKTGRFRRVW